MSRISYDTVETLLYDPVAPNRAMTRSALYAMGFRRIESVATLEAFNECVMRRPPDLAVAESQGVEDQLCESIQAVRQGLVAYNPFLVLIVTAWENQNSLVQRVLNSGADDLLLRPFSATLLESRIKQHVERRKGFVITSDYIGPDRRRLNSRRPDSAELFQPPNSLKMKAKERISSEEAAQRLDAELQSARKTLTNEKLRRDVFQICVLWRIMQGYEENHTKYDVDLGRLRETTKAVARRARDTEYETALEWCDDVLSAIEGVALGVDRAASMHLLGHAALKLNQVFDPGRSQDEYLAEIDATVGAVRARNQSALAS
jgi:DNA-binding response OmpR family regulator